MPWKSGKAFAKAHNQKLTGEAAEKAADIANAMLKKGADEGVAIATANKKGNAMMKRRGAVLYDNKRSKK